MIQDKFKPGDEYSYDEFRWSFPFGANIQEEVLRRLPDGCDLVVTPEGRFRVCERTELPEHPLPVRAFGSKVGGVMYIPVVDAPKPMSERPEDRRYFFDKVLDQGEVEAVAQTEANRIHEAYKLQRQRNFAYRVLCDSPEPSNPAAGYARSARNLPCYGQNQGSTGVDIGSDPSRSKPGAILAVFDNALSVLFFLCIMSVCLPLAILVDAFKRNRRPD